MHVLLGAGTVWARQWLSDRAADHDRLIVESIVNENPDPASGSHVVGLSFARRTSDTLKALGHPDGIVPTSAAKIVFSANDDRIRAFANGPGGGSAGSCRPR